MMSPSAERAIEAVVYLAQHAEQPQSAEQISAAIKHPATSLIPNLERLTKAHILHLPRGPQGGFTLLRRPESLTFFDIVSAIDDVRDSQRLSASTASLAHHLDDARTQLDATYRATTIARYMRDRPHMPSPRH